MRAVSLHLASSLWLSVFSLLWEVREFQCLSQLHTDLLVEGPGLMALSSAWVYCHFSSYANSAYQNLRDYFHFLRFDLWNGILILSQSLSLSRYLHLTGDWVFCHRWWKVHRYLKTSLSQTELISPLNAAHSLQSIFWFTCPLIQVLNPPLSRTVFCQLCFLSVFWVSFVPKETDKTSLPFIFPGII